MVNLQNYLRINQDSSRNWTKKEGPRGSFLAVIALAYRWPPPYPPPWPPPNEPP